MEESAAPTFVEWDLDDNTVEHLFPTQNQGNSGMAPHLRWANAPSPVVTIAPPHINAEKWPVDPSNADLEVWDDELPLVEIEDEDSAELSFDDISLDMWLVETDPK